MAISGKAYGNKIDSREIFNTNKWSFKFRVNIQYRNVSRTLFLGKKLYFCNIYEI